MSPIICSGLFFAGLKYKTRIYSACTPSGNDRLYLLRFFPVYAAFISLMLF